MINLILRLIVNAVALWVASQLVAGIDLSSDIVSVLIVAAIFGIVNALLKPIAILLSLPALILTLGLFTLVINAAMLAVTAWISSALDIDGFWSAILGAVVVSVVSWILSALVD